MPLPVIPAAIALASLVGFGVKKGRDGLASMGEAKKIGEKAQALHEKWVQQLEGRRSELQSRLKELDDKRHTVMTTTFRKLFEFLERLDQKARMEALKSLGNLGVSREQVKEFVAQYVQAGGVLSGGVAAALTGAGASSATTSLVTSFAVAGTGTAVSGLSGAAASNALLAWLGGGSLASGGFGIAGGTVMLGGIALAPAALVAGFVIAREGEKAKTKAEEYQAEVRRKVAHIQAAIELLIRAGTRVDELQIVTTQLDVRTQHAINALWALDGVFDTDDDQHLRTFAMAMQLAKAESELLRVQVFTPQGEINEQLDELLSRQRQLVEGVGS